MKVDKFKRGQIWWLLDTKNYQDSVQGGNRPVIIVSNNINNRYSSNITVIPCTSKEKADLPTHIIFDIETKSTALVEGIQTVSINQLSRYIGTCDQDIMNRIDKALKIALDLTSTTIKDNYGQPNTTIHKTAQQNIKDIPSVQSKSANTTNKRIKYTIEDMQKYIDEYVKHGINYVIEKYNEKSDRSVFNKVYRFRKLLGVHK